MSSLIEARARIEQNRDLSGVEDPNKQHSEEQIRKRRLAKLGVEFEPEQGEISAQAYVSPLAYKYISRLDEKPVLWKDMKALDPNVRMTKGLYMIKYTPPGSREYRKGRPFKLGQDLMRWDIRLAGVRHWHSLCEKIPELRWLSRNSTLTDGMFDLAKKYPGMTFFFTMKWEEYDNKIQAQLDEMNISLSEEKPLVSRKCSFKDYKEIHAKNDKAIMLRYWNDVLKEIQETEMSSAVQEEMLAATGETAITKEEYIKGHGGNHQPRDPVTGQFIHKNKTASEPVSVLGEDPEPKSKGE